LRAANGDRGNWGTGCRFGERRSGDLRPPSHHFTGFEVPGEDVLAKKGNTVGGSRGKTLSTNNGGRKFYGKKTR